MNKRKWIILIAITFCILGISVLLKHPIPEVTPPPVTPPPVGYKSGAPAISPDGAVYQYDGCYVVPSYWAVSSGCPSIATNAEGVMIRAFWDAIETSEGVYDWSTVITHTATITGGGRDVGLVLAIYAGGGSPGPTDLSPAYLQNRIGSYSLVLDGCPTIEMPKYDHPAYLAALKNLVTSAANNVGNIVDVVFIGDGYDDESWPVRPIGSCDYTSVLPFDASTYYHSFVMPLITHYRSAFGVNEPIYWAGSPTLSEQARNDVIDHAAGQNVGYAPQSIWASDSRSEMTYISDYGGQFGVMRIYEDDIPLSAGVKTAKWRTKEIIWYLENKLLMFPLDLVTIQKAIISTITFYGDWTYYTDRRGSTPWTNDYSFIIAHSPEHSRISAGQTWWPWHYDIEHLMYPVLKTDSPRKVYKYVPDASHLASPDFNGTLLSHYAFDHASKYSRHFWWLEAGADTLYLDVDNRWKYHAQQPTDNSGLFKADINIISIGNEITVYYKDHAGAEQSYAVPAQAGSWPQWTEDTESLTNLYLNDQYTWGGDIRLVCATPPCAVHKVEIKGSWAAGSTPTPVNAWATPKFTPNWEPWGTPSTPYPTPTPNGSGGLVSMVLHATDDTYINSASATANTGSTQQLRIATDVATLLRFDLSSVPSGAYVDSATLELEVVAVGGASGQEVTAYKVLRNWEEHEATWNIAETGTNWGTAGCQNTTTDRSSSSSGTATENNGAGSWLSFDITSLVSDWLTTNNGLVLKTSGSELAQLFFYSRDYSEVHAPRLTLLLTYDAPDHTPTPASTYTPTPTPNLPLSISLEGTPYANMGSITYTIQVSNPGVDLFYGQVIFDFDDELPFVASTPPASFETDAWVGWVDQSFLGNTQTDFVCYLEGPSCTGEYTQGASGVAYDMTWSSQATAVATFENTTPTAVPTATPTATATSAATSTPTPTWTPYPTPVYGVQINEICPAPDEDHNKNGVADSLDLFIELRAYDTATDITGWKIGVIDSSSWTMTWYLIPATTIIAVDDHLVIFGSQKLRVDTVHQERTDFVLGNEGRCCIRLVNASGVWMDGVCYNMSDEWWEDAPSNVLQTGDCYGRMPDGSVDWQRLEDCTPSGANGE